jgi:hypothetical protein
MIWYLVEPSPNDCTSVGASCGSRLIAIGTISTETFGYLSSISLEYQDGFGDKGAITADQLNDQFSFPLFEVIHA